MLWLSAFNAAGTKNADHIAITQQRQDHSYMMFLYAHNSITDAERDWERRPFCAETPLTSFKNSMLLTNLESVS